MPQDPCRNSHFHMLRVWEILYDHHFFLVIPYNHRLKPLFDTDIVYFLFRLQLTLLLHRINKILQQ
jgi:hypothetical protein